MLNDTQRVTGFILPVGGRKVGKTSIARVLNNLSPGQFNYGWIIENVPKTKNLEFEFVSTFLNYNHMRYKVTIQLYIPPGYEENEGDKTSRSFEDVIGIYRSIIRRVDVVLLTYSLENKESFNHLDYWVSAVKDLTNSNTNFILLGTYLDMINRREVTQEQISLYLSSTKSHIKKLRPDWTGNLESIEVSSLTGENCENLKALIATQILKAQGFGS